MKLVKGPRKPESAAVHAGRKLGPRALLTRRRLLDATESLLRERGVMDITVAEIARVGETSPATFYHYFEDVEAAVLMLAVQVSDELPRALSQLDGDWAGRDGISRARDLSEAFIDHWEQHHAVLLVRNLAADQGDERFQNARRAALSPVMNRLAEIIETAKADGSVVPEIHAQVAAAALVAILERLSAHYRDLRTFRASRSALVETCARIIYQTIGGDSAD
ncbi:MAG: TetR/AcrR family transcriptional regulator [Deltaproteobacteria bacterium]|nr:TetR/AcrR family transcriptional regulator [Deltaproteobacteria bacterium]